MKALLALLKKLYGSKAIQKALGTRTNVITLPDKDTKRFLTQDLNIEEASDAAIDKAYKDIEKLIPEVPKMNDQELLNFTTNLRRMDNRLNPPSAEVVDIRTSKPVAGIEQLAAERGFPRGMEPDSPLGQLLQSSRKIDDEIAKAKSTEGNIPFTMVTPKGDVKGSGTADDIFNMLTNPTRPGGPLDPNTGIVRTAARQILRKRLDAGEIDIPDAAERDAIAKGYQGGVDPIEVFRKRFGEDALQDLTEIADDLNRAGDFNEIDEILKRNKMFEVPPKAKYEPDPGGMTDEELREILKKGDVDPDDTGFKDGGRVNYAYGSGLKLVQLLKKAGTNLRKALKEAKENVQLSGDNKLDADVIVDDMLETYNIDRDAVDGYDLLDAYGKAYDDLTGSIPVRNKPKKMSAPVKGETPKDFDSAINQLEELGATQLAMRFKLKQKYPGINEDLVTQIVEAPENVRAQMLADMDNAMELMKKGKGSEEVVDILKMEPRTKQAEGGVAYLMGL